MVHLRKHLHLDRWRLAVYVPHFSLKDSLSDQN
jgi:hypothetical protein